MRRRPEAYHARLIEHQAAAEAAAEAADKAAETGAAEASEPKTIHDIVTVKEPGLAALLHYDRHERRSGLIYLLASGSVFTAEQLAAGDWEDLGDFAEEPFEVADLTDGGVTLRRLGAVRSSGAVRRGRSVRADTHTRSLTVEKMFAFGGNRRVPTLELVVGLENTGQTELAFELAVEWNLNLLGGGHNPAAWYELPDRTRAPHDGSGDLAAASKLAFGNDHEGVKIGATIEPAAHLTWYPVETVSNSEGGFERVYQGSSLLARWPVSLAPGESTTRTIGFRAVQSIDRASEEAH
jgi:alpha-amylase